MPPPTGAPAAAGSAAASPAPLLHCPSAPTRSAAVTGRSANSFLPPEKVAQSGLRSNVSGLGTSVTPFKLRSDEHAAMAQASVAIAIMRNPIWFTRCIATALTPATGLDRRAQQARFCVSIITLINRCFCRQTRRFSGRSTAVPDGKRRARITLTTTLLRPRLRLRDPDRDDPGDPEEQKIHRQEGRQACRLHVSFNHEPNKIGNEIPRDHQHDVDDEQGHARFSPLPQRLAGAIFQHFSAMTAMALAERR